MTFRSYCFAGKSKLDYLEGAQVVVIMTSEVDVWSLLHVTHRNFNKVTLNSQMQVMLNFTQAFTAIFVIVSRPSSSICKLLHVKHINIIVKSYILNSRRLAMYARWVTWVISIIVMFCLTSVCNFKWQRKQNTEDSLVSLHSNAISVQLTKLDYHEINTINVFMMINMIFYIICKQTLCISQVTAVGSDWWNVQRFWIMDIRCKH